MANRQDGPHAHCDVFHPSYQWMFVPDLGDNCIYQYGFKGGKLVPQGYATLEKGFGPRHFVFHPTLPVAYSGCELRNCVQVFGIDATEPEEVKVSPPGPPPPAGCQEPSCSAARRAAAGTCARRPCPRRPPRPPRPPPRRCACSRCSS
jgi:6-phosphogluconolactonase